MEHFQKDKLDELQLFVDDNKDLLNKIYLVSNDLQLGIDVAKIQAMNKKLESLVSKWISFLEREKKLDEIIETVNVSEFETF